MAKVAVIPARMASSRFPGKPLKKILGISMIEHVYRRVLLCKKLDDVVVATCDKEIFNEVKRFGGKAVMTSPKHPGCVDRVAEVVRKMPKISIVVNVQGDIPMVDPASLGKLVEPFDKDKTVICTDMMGTIESEEDKLSSNVVKVVTDLKNNALYYSREPIPSCKKLQPGGKITMYKQFGINAFTRKAILQYAAMKRAGLEDIESVDMLRFLQRGMKVLMVHWGKDIVGVDISEDMQRAEKILLTDKVYLKHIRGKDVVG